MSHKERPNNKVLPQVFPSLLYYIISTRVFGFCPQELKSWRQPCSQHCGSRVDNNVLSWCTHNKLVTSLPEFVDAALLPVKGLHS